MRKISLAFCFCIFGCQSGPGAERAAREMLEANPCPAASAYDDAKVKQAIQGLTSEFKKCYSEKMKEKSNVAGRVCLTWDITKSGSVEKLQLISVEKNRDQSDHRDELLLACLQDKMRAARVPTPRCRREPCVVRYPVNFVNE